MNFIMNFLPLFKKIKIRKVLADAKKSIPKFNFLIMSFIMKQQKKYSFTKNVIKIKRRTNIIPLNYIQANSII